MIHHDWQSARHILAVRLDNLGDVLVTTPAFHAIKRSLPEAHLTLLASPMGAQAGYLNPDIDDVIEYQAPWMDPWRRLPQVPERERQMIATIAERDVDGAVIFTSFRQSSLPASYLCYLAGVPLRHAASIDGPGSLLTTRHRHPEHMMHEVERGLDLVSGLGFTTAERDLVLHVPAGDRARAAAIRGELMDASSPSPSGWGPPSPSGWGPPSPGGRGASPGGWGRPLIVIHPGCSMPARTYPWEMYAAVADRLIERLGATVVLTGSEEERELTACIRSRMRHPAFDYAGQLPFPTFCALIETADLTVTNNTGPMHIAAAVKTPVVALFALTNPPEQWGPWQVSHRQLYHEVPCRVCYSRICPRGQECLRLVTPEMVVAAAAELLDLSGPRLLYPLAAFSSLAGRGESTDWQEPR